MLPSTAQPSRSGAPRRSRAPRRAPRPRRRRMGRRHQAPHRRWHGAEPMHVRGWNVKLRRIATSVCAWRATWASWRRAIANWARSLRCKAAQRGCGAASRARPQCRARPSTYRTPYAARSASCAHFRTSGITFSARAGAWARRLHPLVRGRMQLTERRQRRRGCLRADIWWNAATRATTSRTTCQHPSPARSGRLYSRRRRRWPRQHSARRAIAFASSRSLTRPPCHWRSRWRRTASGAGSAVPIAAQTATARTAAAVVARCPTDRTAAVALARLAPTAPRPR
mmetsp:Transcript_8899/g.27638  ORF Transcript_8899/g.27638 Transcript_8899/m.27638 type:complete len:283 (+) Transcript_8899:843-1691(+)